LTMRGSSSRHLFTSNSPKRDLQRCLRLSPPQEPMQIDARHLIMLGGGLREGNFLPLKFCEGWESKIETAIVTISAVRELSLEAHSLTF
jgi:hypothetical protein